MSNEAFFSLMIPVIFPNSLTCQHRFETDNISHSFPTTGILGSS